jgi:NADH-quinone oxidoreductase subunit H
LVAGYFVEYSAFGFAFFFIAEYANIILMSALSCILFFGGWLPPLNIKLLYLIPPYFWFGIKLLVFLSLFVFVRAAFPRYRFDQLLYLCWRIILPLSLSGLILTASIVWGFTYDIQYDKYFSLSDLYEIYNYIK